MKVLFWINIGLDRRSTSGHLLIAMMERVVELGDEVHLLLKDSGGSEKEQLVFLEKLGVKIIYVKADIVEKGKFTKRYIEEVKYVIKSGRKIYRDYDAVFIQSNFVAGFSVWFVKHRCSKAKITFNVQDIYPQDILYAGRIGKRNPLYIAMYLVQRYAYKHVDNIITISEDMKDEIVQAGAPPKRISVIYNWSYQDDLFDKKNISREVKSLFDNKYFNVVYAGNIGLFQNVDIVLDAAILMKDVPDVWFHIFGGGLYKEVIQKRAESENVSNISFHPIQPHELATSVYASASVNIIPLGTNQYRTALPSKTATCLACQSPIIFAIGKESKFGKFVNQNTGCPVVDCTDARDLVNAIKRIKNNDVVINTGDFFVDNFSITNNSKKYALIITGRRFISE